MKKIYKLITVLALTCLLGILAGCQDEEYISDVQNNTCDASLTEITPTPGLEPTALPTEPVKQEITICMVGDILMHTPVSDSGIMEDGSIDYSHLFYNTKDIISNADLAIVNQEVILGGEELRISGYPTFNARTEVGDALAQAGFDVVCHATNHCLDRGCAGIDATLNFWKENYPNIDAIGINQSPDEFEHVCIREVEGVKIAVLNYTYGTNGIPIPSDKSYCVSMLDKDKIAKDVSFAKENADFIIACPHWGTEYMHTPDSSQKSMAEYFNELGVDLVMGTHPHVIQPYEYVGNTLVYYSLGNFVNATSGTGAGVADRMLGEIAYVTIEKSDDGITVGDYTAIPIVSHLDTSAPGKITVYKLDDYTEELSLENEIKSQDPSFSLEYITKLWQSCNNM